LPPRDAELEALEHLEVIRGGVELGWCAWLNLVIAYRRIIAPRPE
jgi:hypothetical protein